VISHPSIVDFLEVAAVWMSNDTADAAVAHEKIRTSSDNEQRQMFICGKSESVPAKACSVRGSTQNCAGPPTRSVV
jgi:hypothetical protein